MRYMLLIYGAENCWTDAERRECMHESLKLCDELAAQNKFIAASPLHPVATATTVRVREGKTLVTDGPFAETTEQLGGFYLLELENLDEVIAVASRLPPVSKGTVEIRPVYTLEGLPPSRTLRSAFQQPNVTPFMFLCYDNEEAWAEAGPEALKAAMAEAAGLCRELHRQGRYISASPLHPVSTATCVRIRNGKRHITDGPFAETNEVLGGFYVIVAESQEEAVRIAARHSGAPVGAVEVRALFNLAGLRETDPSW